MKYLKPRLNSLSSKAVIVLLSAGLIIGDGIAQEPIPEPTTFTDLSVPQLTGWNTDNIATVDGVTGATEKSFVYESAAAKDNPLIDAFVHEFMYGSHRTWALVPEDGESVELLWGWLVVVWHLR